MHEKLRAFSQTLTAKLLLFALGVAILIARNTDPLVNPALYTEDGAWSGLLYSFGAATAYLDARPDYFVIGNVALLHVAALLNDLFAPDELAQLPIAVAVVSYVFYAACAAFIATALKPYLELRWCLACWLAILLLPMGGHMNEVLGRVSNVGYLFYVLATVIVLSRLRLPARQYTFGTFGLDAALLLCVFTNPLCAPLLAGACIVEIAMHRRALSARTLALAVVTAAGFWTLYTGSRLPQPDGSVDLSVALTEMVPFVVARPLVYPFVFPFYQSLSDVWSILAATAIAAYLVWGWSASPRKLEFGYLLFALGLVTVATTLARPGLYIWLVDYKLSFPDRYFYAQNVLILLAFIWATAELSVRYQSRRAVPLAAFWLVAAIWAYGADALFDPFATNLTVRTGPSFAEQLDAAPPAPRHPGLLLVGIYPEGWTAFFPEGLR